MSMNVNRPKTTLHPRGRRSSDGYVVLPGHPFFGERVRILQHGQTEGGRWCLIAHPAREQFHYRFPARWLSEEPPDRKIAHRRGRCEISLPREALEGLVRMVQGLIRSTPVERSDGKPTTAPDSSGDLATPAAREQRGARRETALRPAPGGRSASDQ